jgi:hypothetical protein
MRRLVLPLLAALVLAGCGARDVDKDLKITDVHTGWFDAGIVQGKNKIVPSISFKIQNVSQADIATVQINAVFRRKGEEAAWGEHYVSGIDSKGLAPGATGNAIVLRSTLGYTGEEPRLKMLQNHEFVDARVEIFGKHRSKPWVKMGEFQIDRQLLTE